MNPHRSTPAHIVLPAVATLALIGGLLWFLKASVPAGALPPIPSGPNETVIKPKGSHLRCARVSQTPDAPEGSSARRTEAELYLAIVNASPYANSPLIVEQVSIPMPKHPNPVDSRGFAEWETNALRLVEIGYLQCTGLTADRFPDGTRLLPPAESPRHAAELVTRVSGAKQWFAFSRARIDDQRGDAVVFYERICDGCGVGEWVWFHRGRPDEPWRIMRRKWAWIN